MTSGPQQAFPELTRDAVRLALSSAGIAAAQKQAGSGAVSAGFQAYEILAMPAPGAPRIVVQWHTGYTAPKPDAAEPGQHLAICAETLQKAGYKTHRLVDSEGEYLVVWVHGEF
jgi:hypothetical protein